MISRRFVTLAGACAMLGASLPASAQQWPQRNVKVVVPYGVGGVTDIMARLTADRLGKMLGQTFVIENKLGAGGTNTANADKVFDKLDKDGDGALSTKELSAVMKGKGRSERSKRNTDPNPPTVPKLATP